jgi:DNA-binding NarL/FixJ family response regulator
MAISAVLVDDHALFRGGLKQLLEDQDVRVLGEARTGEDGVELVTQLRPDVAVMDLNMPGIGGVEATRRIASSAPETNVLVLTISSDDDSIMQAMLAGATGYMVKDATVEELAGAVHAAAAGDAWLSAPIAVKLLSWLREGQRGAPAREGELSARELDVLRMVAEGRDNADIAEALLVDEHKVKTLVATIVAKLQ